MKKEKTIDDYIYIAIILTICTLVILYIIYVKIGKPDIFKCKIYENLGIYCPGCGCTRAFVSLMNGNLIESFKYNPTVLYTVITTIIYLASRTIGKITKNENSKYIMKYRSVYIYIGMTILIVTCILKNIEKIIYKFDKILDLYVSCVVKLLMFKKKQSTSHLRKVAKGR